MVKNMNHVQVPITLLFCDLCDKESNEMIGFFKPL